MFTVNVCMEKSMERRMDVRTQDALVNRNHRARARCASKPLEQPPRTVLLQPFNHSMPAPRKWSHHNVTSTKMARSLCTGTPTAQRNPAGEQPLTPHLICADFLEAQRRSSAVRLFVGIMTGPNNRERRDAVRQTWMSYPNVGFSVVACFVIGRRQVPNATLARMDIEFAEHRDLLFLPSIADGCVKMVSIGKMHAFWVAAAGILRHHHRSASAPLIVKVDDDSFVNLPLLEVAVEPLNCLSRLYYGAIGFTGYQPAGFQNCGFAWGGGAAYTRYGCAARGAHPPFPFVLGQLQVLSLPLVVALAASADATEFAAAAEAALDTLANEDSALGHMISMLPEVTYINMPSAAWHNLGCFADLRRSMYRTPTNASIVVHRILSVAALRFTWDAVRGRLPPSWLGAPEIATCVEATSMHAYGSQVSRSPHVMHRMQNWCRRCSNRTDATVRKSECYESLGTKQRAAATLASCRRSGYLPSERSR